jgi:hypothetical protein
MAELGKWFKVWVEENGDGSDFNDGVNGWLNVTRNVDTLTVTFETGFGAPETEYYRVTRIAEPPTSIPLT